MSDTTTLSTKRCGGRYGDVLADALRHAAMLDDWLTFDELLAELRRHDCALAIPPSAPGVRAGESWTPDQPLRADATREQIADRMQHLYTHAKSLADATAPWYAMAMVVEVQNAFAALPAAATTRSAWDEGYDEAMREADQRFEARHSESSPRRRGRSCEDSLALDSLPAGAA